MTNLGEFRGLLLWVWFPDTHTVALGSGIPGWPIEVVEAKCPPGGPVTEIW